MGVSIHFWPLPPSSTLFQRLQSEKPLALLMGDLFHYGAGIFYFFDEHDEDEQGEILSSVITRNLEAFGSPEEAERCIGEFKDELDRTRRACPGIEKRRFMLGKSQDLIEERLERELQRLGGADAAKLANKLICGEQSIFQGLDSDQIDSAWMVSPELVREGSKILASLDVHSLFPEAREMEDFERWRQFYSDAAARGELLAVGVC